MNAPILWIVFPGAAAIILYLFRRWPRAVTLAGTLLAILLAYLAWKLPIGEIIEIGPLSFKVSNVLRVFGRQYLIDNVNRPTLALIYLAAAFWFGGSYSARAGRLFVPAGLGIVTLMTAALAVQPFLYAALLIEMAALLGVTILAIPGRPVSRGIFRFLTFQTLGVPFILFSGWMLERVEANPDETSLIVQTTVLIGLGFSFLLAIFPFHSWMPMLAEEAHPYAAAFVFFMLPGIVSLFGLTFLEKYAWLRSSPGVFAVLRSAGVLMVVTGGLFALFQRHFSRLLGFAVTVEIGLSLLAAGINRGILPGSPGLETSRLIFNTLFIARGLGLGVWALGLTAIRVKVPEMRFRNLAGIAKSMPVAASAILLAHLSMAGFPLLSGFPARLVLWEHLSSASPLVAFWTLVGCAGLMAAALRTMAVMVMGQDGEHWQITESRPLLFLLVTGCLALILTGIFPLGG